MPKMNVIVDMGTSNVSVFCKNLLLREPNIALIRRKNGAELVAFGSDALNMVGVTDENCSFICPVSDGVIVNSEVAGLIIAHCLNKVLSKKLFTAIKIYAVIPCGLSVAERESAEAAFYKAGYKDVTLVESVLGFLPFVDGAGTAVADIGGGTTELAVLTDKGILSGCSLNVGGKEIDRRVKDKVLDIYNLAISEFAAEKLKTEIGSLYDNNAASMSVAGRGVLDKSVRREDISAENIKGPISFCYKKIVDVAESLFTTIPSGMVRDVAARGIYFGGGGAAMHGLQDFVTKYLGINAYIDPEPETVILRGIDKLIESGKTESFHK
ncbi:MAG: hypothetical protein GX095_02595 [Clostridiales bacterium]|jgi:rod shape-determining protein MreB|nr:hypothetical protein [Clostridiales bacterium]HOK81199.1 rod shape-determining protein [Clostridia bacterium]HOL60318.1 rod shape-determining protein [Clostridia bacterium]HPO53075.1 rod shape-determining protein [Clostridia bacterium]